MRSSSLVAASRYEFDWRERSDHPPRGRLTRFDEAAARNEYRRIAAVAEFASKDGE